MKRATDLLTKAWNDPLCFELPAGAGKYGAALADLAHPCSDLQKHILEKVTATRDEVQRGDTVRYVGHFNNLSNEVMEYLRAQVLLLVRGYDKDSREIYQIPKVRTYWQLVNEDHPTLLFFAALSHPHILQAVFACLAPNVEVVRHHGSDRIQVRIDGQSLQSLLAEQMAMCVSMNAFMGTKAHDGLALLAATLEALLHPKGRRSDGPTAG